MSCLVFNCLVIFYYYLSFDFKFAFDCICLGREKLELEPLSKLALMADNAIAIGNGFRESKCNCGVRGNCWFHCKKGVDKELACVKNLEKKADILVGIYELQVCQTPEIFKAASALFIELWGDDEDEAVKIFIKYFKDNWLVINCNWFESYNHPNNAGSCSSNNGNEAINGVIKRQDTLRELLPLTTFLLVSCNIVLKWSRARDPKDVNYKPFATEPTIKLCQWTLGWQWKQEFNKYIWRHPDNPDCWFINSRDGVLIEGSEVIKQYEKQMSQCNWTTFAAFVNCAFGYWKVTIKEDANENNWYENTIF